MDIRLVRLLEDTRDGAATSSDVARFLARYSWQLLESPIWEDMAVTSELEHTIAEIQAGLEDEGILRTLAQEVLNSFVQPAAIIQRNVIVEPRNDSGSPANVRVDLVSV